jgi:predicted phosphate transport protein (TIGR00153 family)
MKVAGKIGLCFNSVLLLYTVWVRYMTYPMETEANLKRRMLDLCQIHARNVVEITRHLTVLVDNVAEGKLGVAKENYASLLKAMGENEKNKATFLIEVASVGSLLISREDFLRLLFRLDEIADYCEAIGDRLIAVTALKWKFDTKKLQQLSKLMSLILKEISKLRETIHSLSFDPEKAMETAKSVEELEHQIDVESRRLNLELLGSKLPLPTMLSLRDVVERAEVIADIGVDVVDHIRVLALTS